MPLPDPALKSRKHEGNQVELLENGDEIFPAMLAALRIAQRTVCFETYIYWSGEIAQEFADVLIECSKRDVRVHVLLDWYGALKMEEELIERMRRGRVEIEFFNPLTWRDMRRMNNRTHRKLLIVDGKVGFTGGVGIADEWSGHAEDPSHWRDNHYKIEGPVVADMQGAFFRNWAKMGRQCPEENDGDYFPKLESVGDTVAEVRAGAPHDGSDRILNLFIDALAGANHKVRIGTAYFMPGKRLMREILNARKRGVEVELLVCGKHIDKQIVRRASRYHWGKLIKAGVEVYEFDPTLYHVKMVIIDDRMVSIGSANFDERSCVLNDELNVILHSKEQVVLHVINFDEDKANAHQVTLEDWKGRSVRQKVLDAAVQLFRHLM
jgi:cardiolipin synthase